MPPVRRDPQVGHDQLRSEPRARGSRPGRASGARRCDLLLADRLHAGRLPDRRRRARSPCSQGARVVIVNGSPTAMDDLADAVLTGSISEVLPAARRRTCRPVSGASARAAEVERARARRQGDLLEHGEAPAEGGLPLRAGRSGRRRRLRLRPSSRAAIGSSRWGISTTSVAPKSCRKATISSKGTVLLRARWWMTARHSTRSGRTRSTNDGRSRERQPRPGTGSARSRTRGRMRRSPSPRSCR